MVALSALAGASVTAFITTQVDGLWSAMGDSMLLIAGTALVCCAAVGGYLAGQSGSGRR